MSRRRIALLTISSLGLLAAVGASEAPAPQVTLFFTGYVQGSFEPCD